ncbi:MAG: DUF2726 domain-containing protein [Candidatus Saccharimonadales bacterium]
MDSSLLFFLGVVAAIILVSAAISKLFQPKRGGPARLYSYSRKKGIMTDAEKEFYRRLQRIVREKYIIFPQVHLSSLAHNKTKGKYYKAGFQRINRRSVDYVLADPETLDAVYAVELDDRTHDTQKARVVDRIKNEILQEINLPLVRFRNVRTMSDDDIVRAFEAVKRT